MALPGREEARSAAVVAEELAPALQHESEDEDNTRRRREAVKQDRLTEGRSGSVDHKSQAAPKGAKPAAGDSRPRNGGVLAAAPPMHPSKVSPVSMVSPRNPPDAHLQRKLIEAVDALETESRGSRSGFCTPTRSTASTRTSSKLSSRSTVGKGAVRYTKFAIEGFAGDKHAVLIPDDVPVTSALFHDILEALRLETPSLMLSGVGTLCHPSKLGSPQLLNSPEIRETIDDAMEDLGDYMDASSPSLLAQCCGVSTVEEDDGRELEKQNLLNSVMERRVAATIRTIADAAAQTNTWTFTGPKISNFEVFLQRYMERGDADIFSVVAAHMQDRAYVESELAKELMQRLIDGSNVLTPKGATNIDPIILPGDLWSPEYNLSNREFSKNGFDFWSFEQVNDERARGHPLLQWPWPWAHLFFLFYHREDASRGGFPDQPDWTWTTDVRFDWSALPIQFDLLSSSGYVFLGGDEAAKRKLLQAMEAGRPAVLLDNTPLVAKQASVFFNIIRNFSVERPRMDSALRAFLSDGAADQLGDDPTSLALIQALSPSKILKYIESQFECSDVQAEARLRLTDIMCMLDLLRQRPQFAQQRVCVLDPFVDGCTEQEDGKRLCSLFCCDDMGNLDHSHANRSIVVKAWGAHSRFHSAAARYWSLWIKLEVATSACILACTTLGVAVFNMKLRQMSEIPHRLPHHLDGPLDATHPSVSDEVMLQVMQFLLVILPLLGGALHLMLSHMGFCEKWRNADMVANQIIAEVHKFLGKVGPYSAHPSWSRHVFMQRLNELSTNWSLQGCSDDTEADEQSDLFMRNPKALDSHIVMALHSSPRQGAGGLTSHLQRLYSLCCCPRGRGRRSRLILDHEGGQSIDRTAPVNADTYLDLRLTPLIKHYQAKARLHAACRRWLGFAVLLLVSGTSALVGAGLALWVPVPMALAGFLGLLSRWLAPLQASSAIDLALGALSCLELRWHARTLSQQRQDAAREQLIDRTEAVALALVQSLSQAAPLMLDEEKEATQWLEMRPNSIPGALASGSSGMRISSNLGGRETPRLSRQNSAHLPDKALRVKSKPMTPISSRPESPQNRLDFGTPRSHRVAPSRFREDSDGDDFNI